MASGRHSRVSLKLRRNDVPTLLRDVANLARNHLLYLDVDPRTASPARLIRDLQVVYSISSK